MIGISDEFWYPPRRRSGRLESQSAVDFFCLRGYMADLRATFLLKLVLLIFALLVFLLALWAVFSAQALLLPGLIFLAIFWFVGLELDVLPLLLERWATRYAERSGRPISNLWFVDRQVERREAFEAFDKQSKDNPTIR